MKAKEVFQNRYFRIVFAVLAAFLWGSAFPSVKIGYEVFDISVEETYKKILFAGYRFLLAGLLIFVFAVASRQKLQLKTGMFKDIFILGLLTTTVQYLFFYIGLSNTTGVKGAVINSTSVFFTLVLAHFLLEHDRMNRKKFLGLTAGFIGVVLINYSPALLSFDFKPNGEGLLLAAQLSGAFGAIYLKKISDDISAVVLTSYQMLMGSLLLILPGILKLGLWPFSINFKGALLLFYLSFLSATAFSLWNTLLKYNFVGKISIFKFLIPVFGVILSSLLLKGEGLTSITVLALFVVSLGIIIVYKTD